jgi:hypothetical protein
MFHGGSCANAVGKANIEAATVTTKSKQSALCFNIMFPIFSPCFYEKILLGHSDLSFFIFRPE